MTQLLGTAADLVTALAMVVSCWLMARAMKRSTELRNATEERQKPLEVKIDQALHQQFASKAEFDKHTLEVWREINQLKHDNLEMTKMIGDMSSKIFADLANVKSLSRDL
jgi:hypothetical protein